MKVRILLILPLKGGSYFVGRQVADALKQMKNVELDIFDTASCNTFYEKSFRHIENHAQRLQKIVEHINLAAMGSVVDFRPDIVMVMALAPISPWFIERVKQLGALTAHWYIENFRYYPADPIVPRWQLIAPHYNYFFTIQKGDFHDALDQLGVNNYYYLPVGCHPIKNGAWLNNPMNTYDHSSDICFIGHPYPNRIAVFKSMNQFNISLWGPGGAAIPELEKFSKGNGRWIDADEEKKILQRAKIALNVHSSLNSDKMLHLGDFLNPRVFTIAACGAFQIVDEQEPLHEVFEIGEEVAVYHDLNSLKRQVSYFLDNKEERLKMAKHALIRVLKEHTYKHRMEEMMRIIGL